MSKLVLNVKYLLLLSFLTDAEFYNLGHIQGIIRVPELKRDHSRRWAGEKKVSMKYKTNS